MTDVEVVVVYCTASSQHLPGENQKNQERNPASITDLCPLSEFQHFQGSSPAEASVACPESGRSVHNLQVAGSSLDAPQLE
jgi:hypothetical protein